jgi:hypothetical protein
MGKRESTEIEDLRGGWAGVGREGSLHASTLWSKSFRLVLQGEAVPLRCSLRIYWLLLTRMRSNVGRPYLFEERVETLKLLPENILAIADKNAVECGEAILIRRAGRDS